MMAARIDGKELAEQVRKEVSKGVRLLELFGFPGFNNLNLYFKLINKKKFKNLSIIKKNNKFNKDPFCPIYFLSISSPAIFIIFSDKSLTFL